MMVSGLEAVMFLKNNPYIQCSPFFTHILNIDQCDRNTMKNSEEC